MIKIPTLFKKNPQNLALVIDEINPGCEWVFNGEAIATRKYDGTAAAIINGELYKRYDVKKGRVVPDNAIPCQEPDAITGHWPHWVKCDVYNPEDKYFWEALNNYMVYPDTPPIDGTYELCGPKVQGNPENLKSHCLIFHGNDIIRHCEDMSFEGIKKYLSVYDIEGIVFHHKTDGRMCKIRKSDFGIKRVPVARSHPFAV